MLTSFESGLRAVVIGATGGLGQAFVDTLAQCDRVGAIHALSRSGRCPANPKVTGAIIDLDTEDSVESAANTVKEGGPIDLVLVAVGTLHDERRDIRPEKSWRDLDAATLTAVYQTNTVGPALAMKHFLPLLRRDAKACFAALSARVGSIEDNGIGGWHAYRASKAALNMILRNGAIELARKCPQALCIGLHPGTVDTGLSAPFQRNVPEGKLFTPAYSAERLLHTIDGLDGAQSGKLFAYDGQRIPF